MEVPTSTFGTFYVPILKWKAGEQRALKELEISIKEKITPLIEIVPVPWDYTNECPAKTIDEHLADIGSKLKECWDNNGPLYLDTHFLEDDIKMANGQHYLAYIFDEARKNNIKLIPVTSCQRSLSFQKEVANIYLQDSFGICIRITNEDLDGDLDAKLDETLNELLSTLGIDPNQVDLLIDMAYINPKEKYKNYAAIITTLNSISALGNWRNLILSGCSFPPSLSEINSYGQIPRVEWDIWKKLVTGKVVERIPIFSDYAINHPEYIEVDPRIMQMSANIRYTIDDSWLIFKGDLVKKVGWGQMRSLSTKLVNDPHYCGMNYSWGDKYIYECANGSVGTGNATTWRQVGTNHHITFVVKQISNFSSTSNII